MEKIRVQSSEQVEIEVNDNGDFITLDPLDLDFPLKLNKAVSELEKKTSLFKQAILVIEKREDTKEKNELLTRNQKEKFQKYEKYLDECGTIINNLFGEGTCRKVFGDKKYFGMYEDFVNALEPILKKLYGNTEAVVERVKSKYSKTNNDVL